MVIFNVHLRDILHIFYFFLRPFKNCHSYQPDADRIDHLLIMVEHPQGFDPIHLQPGDLI